MKFHDGMLASDFNAASSFVANGITGLMEWCEDDTGIVAVVKGQDQRALLASIG